MLEETPQVLRAPGTTLEETPQILRMSGTLLEESSQVLRVPGTTLEEPFQALQPPVMALDQTGPVPEKMLLALPTPAMALDQTDTVLEMPQALRALGPAPAVSGLALEETSQNPRKPGAALEERCPRTVRPLLRAVGVSED